MAARNFLPRFIAFELQILNDSIGIRLKNAVHLGKNSSPASLASVTVTQRAKQRYKKVQGSIIIAVEWPMKYENQTNITYTFS